jgi:Cu(I)-responsive transcriptional regulator
MIRHYEQIGLLPEAVRTDAGYRQYGERDVSVLRFIRHARRLGFSMEQIADLIGLWSDRSRASRSVKALAQRHVDDLDAKMRELAAMKQALEGLIASCHGDDDPHCAIIDGLAEGSRAMPEVAPEALRKVRRRAGAAPDAARRTAAASTSHADLMAWTHGLHRHVER